MARSGARSRCSWKGVGGRSNSIVDKTPQPLDHGAGRDQGEMKINTVKQKDGGAKMKTRPVGNPEQLDSARVGRDALR